MWQLDHEVVEFSLSEDEMDEHLNENSSLEPPSKKVKLSSFLSEFMDKLEENNTLQRKILQTLQENNELQSKILNKLTVKKILKTLEIFFTKLNFTTIMEL